MPNIIISPVYNSTKINNLTLQYSGNSPTASTLFAPAALEAASSNQNLDVDLVDDEIDIELKTTYKVSVNASVSLLNVLKSV